MPSTARLAEVTTAPLSLGVSDQFSSFETLARRLSCPSQAAHHLVRHSAGCSGCWHTFSAANLAHRATEEFNVAPEQQKRLLARRR
jgi:hypothetical protein